MTNIHSIQKKAPQPGDVLMVKHPGSDHFALSVADGERTGDEPAVWVAVGGADNQQWVPYDASVPLKQVRAA